MMLAAATGHGRQYESSAPIWHILPPVDRLMPHNTSESGILTLKEVAEYLKVTERTIYRLAAAALEVLKRRRL